VADHDGRHDLDTNRSTLLDCANDVAGRSAAVPIGLRRDLLRQRLDPGNECVEVEYPLNVAVNLELGTGSVEYPIMNMNSGGYRSSVMNLPDNPTDHWHE
jgi:hypothetical protein